MVRLRSAIAAIIGWFLGLIAGLVALGPGNQHAGLVIPMSIFFGVLVALPVAIIIDLITRGREKDRTGRSPLRHPIRATKAVLAPWVVSPN